MPKTNRQRTRLDLIEFTPMSLAASSTPHTPQFLPRSGLIPYWTMGLLAVGLVSRESVVAQASERQKIVLKLASEFKAIELTQ